MKEKVISLKESALEEIKKTQKEADVLNCKAKYLGKKSELSEYLSSLKDLKFLVLNSNNIITPFSHFAFFLQNIFILYNYYYQ